MNFIRKEEQQMFADFIQVENVPEIMHSYIIPHSRRTVYADAHVFVFKQYLEAPQFKVWQHHVVAAKDSDIYVIADHPALHLGISLSSLGVHSTLRGTETEYIQTGELNFLYVTPDEKRVSISPGTHCFVCVEVDQDLLREMLTQPHQVAYLQEKIEPAIAGGTTTMINPDPVPPDAYSSMILDLIRHPRGANDHARRMYINKQCMLLLTYFFAQLQRPPHEPLLTTEDVNNIDSILAHIKQHTGVVVAEELCHLFNIRLEKLQYGFKQLYGTSIHAFIQLWRMERAALLLSSPAADKPLTADFEQEFTRYYNCTPDQFRKL
jgi:AraC-like DNA-binding protein